MQWNASLIIAAIALAGCSKGEVRPEYGMVPAPAYAPDPPPVAAQAAPPRRSPDPADPTVGMVGPRGTSQSRPGEQRYDAVGYAGIRGVDGGGTREAAVLAIHPSLPANSYVEVTALDSGKTILVLVTGKGDTGGDVIELSSGAVRKLGHDGSQPIPVRVRLVNPPPQDQAALRAGGAADARVDAPESLLRALRKQLPPLPAAARTPPVSNPDRTVVLRTPPAPVRGRAPAPKPPVHAASMAAHGRYLVQVAALSSSSRAQALAQRLGGSVKAGGGLYRVQLGPFATNGEAQAAKARAARAGYGDARILPVR